MTNNQELPNGWIQAKLDDIRFDESRSLDPKKYSDQYFELYSVPNFELGRPEHTIGSEIGSTKQVVRQGTVLLCKINPHINRVWVVGDFSEYTKIASTEWIAFPPIDQIDPLYLCYFFQNSSFRNFLSMNVSGVGGSLMRVRPSTLADYSFPLAPLPEQRRIVSKIEELFSDIDAGEANLRAAQKLIATYRQSVLKAAVTGELTRDWRTANAHRLESGAQLLDRILAARRAQWQGRGKYEEPQPPDTRDLPDLPEGWAWASVDQLSIFITSGSRGWATYYSDSGSLFFRSQNITKSGLSLRDIAYVNPPRNSEGARTRLNEDDLLVSITGYPGNIARVPALTSEAYISQHVGLIRLVVSSIAKFVEVSTRAPIIQKYFERVQYGLTKPGLNLTQVSECPVVLPPVEEQLEIVSRLEDLFSRIDALETWCRTELARSATLRQSILKAAFSGQLVPQDPNDEPASVLLERIRAERTSQPPKHNRHKPRQMELF